MQRNKQRSNSITSQTKGKKGTRIKVKSLSLSLSALLAEEIRVIHCDSRTQEWACALQWIFFATEFSVDRNSHVEVHT